MNKEIKLCLQCWHKRFPDRDKPGTVTWGRVCYDCQTPTPTRGLLYKAEVEGEEVFPRKPAKEEKVGNG